MSRIILNEPEPEAPNVPTGPPAKLAAEALQGIAGKIVAKILPYTEAGEAALLFSLLAGFGNQVGREAYTVAGNAKHHARFFVSLVGTTGKARKGTSWNCVKAILAETDEEWAQACQAKGLHSGEGLIYHVRDERKESKPIKEKGRIVDYQDEIADAGVTDKRLFLIEEELGAVLKRMKGRENSLSAILRDAWDGNDLRSMVKNSPDRATEPHPSILAHITKAEASELLTGVDCQNGFANRFLWVYTERSKYLPHAVLIPLEELRSEIEALKNAIQLAENQGGEIPLSPEADELWTTEYRELSEGNPGLFGAVTGRAEAQVRRLSLGYALIEGRRNQSRENMEAALAAWRYCEQTAGWLFGTPFNHPNADRIYEALRKRPKGMTRTEMNGKLFSNHATKERLDEALGILETAGAAYPKHEKTGGADGKRWFLADAAK